MGASLTRRGALGLGLAGAAGALAAATPASAGRAGRPPTFVFVHGGWSSGFNFHRLLERLVTGGRRAVAVDLPRHGQEAVFPASYLSQDLAALATEPSPVADLTIERYVDRVSEVVGAIARATGPVILVGHSLGGATIGLVGNRVPHLLARIVYVAAFLPVELPSVLAYNQTPEAQTSTAPLGPVTIGNPAALGAVRINWRSVDPSYRSQVKAATFADASDAVFTAFSNTWQPDEPAAVLGADSRVAAGSWGRIPRTYVRFTEDQAIPLALQDRMIGEADALTPRNRTQVRSLPGSHLGPFATPDGLVDVLERLAD